MNFLRTRLLAAIALLLTTSPVGEQPVAATPARGLDSVAAFREAHLRKLHLVRPDLIQYPVAFDVIC